MNIPCIMEYSVQCQHCQPLLLHCLNFPTPYLQFPPSVLREHLHEYLQSHVIGSFKFFFGATQQWLVRNTSKALMQPVACACRTGPFLLCVTNSCHVELSHLHTSPPPPFASLTSGLSFYT